MYGMGNSGVGSGMRISPAAKLAPLGGSDGVMVAFPRIGEVPLGAGGTCCTVRVESSSCST